jgi:hypothetical protein
MTACAFTLAPDIHNTDLITMAGTATATTITPTNIGGSGTIIGTITIGTMIATTTGIERMKSLLPVFALALGALTFQSCEDYPNGTSRGYYHGGGYGGEHSDRGYYGDGYYGGGGYGSTVVVSSGEREHHHGDGYSNEYYDRENDHVNRNDHVNGNVNVNRNVQVNRNVNTNRNTHPNRNVSVKRNSRVDRNVDDRHQ